MVDKERTVDFIKRELDGVTRYIQAVDRRADSMEQTIKECRSHCDHCREICTLRDDHEQRLRVLEAMREKMRGACDAKKELWYKDPHWWHSTAAWVAIGAALWMGARGGLH